MTWETEDMSDAQSQSQMTTDTYGYTDAHDQKIIWSDDPEQAYFRAMMQSQDDRSLIGDSTIHDLLEGRQRFMSQDDDSMLLQGPAPRQPGTSGLSYYDTDAEDDTIAKIETDSADQGWFAARRSTMEGPAPGRLSLQTPMSAASPGASVAYKFNSPISALSPRDRAGEGPGVAQPFAVPNPNLVPRTPNGPRGPAVVGEIVTDSEGGDGHQRKIIPGYIFVTEGHSSVVETKKASQITKLPPTDKTPKAKSKSRFSLGRQQESNNPPGQPVTTSKKSSTKSKRDDLTIETGDASELRRKRKLCLCKLGIVFLMLALVVGIAMLALVFRSRQNTEETSQNNILPPTLPPILNTPSPTPPGMVPTASPIDGAETTAPSSDSPPNGNGEPPLPPDSNSTVEIVKEYLVSAFPISATSLEDMTSPQFRALEWLVEGAPPTPGSRLRGRHLQELNFKLIQRWALAVIFLSTGGDFDGIAPTSNWTDYAGWLEPTDQCEWSFIVCDDSGSLTELIIDDNALRGDIPPEIGLLGDKLLKLSFNANDLSGPIPSTVGLLSGLTHLSLQNNTLTGPLPTELLDLSALNTLILSRNLFDGTIPTQVGDLVNLTYIDLALTNLTGTIPTEVGQLMELELISLSNTQITGTIPTQLGDIPSLKVVKLGQMELTGEMPMELCDRTVPLEELRADCTEVECPCCTLCCVDNGECSRPAPSPTVLPTRSPTAATTPPPTKSATSAPTVPVSAPTTSSPTATPPAASTPSPTAALQNTPSPTDDRTPSPTDDATSDSCQSSISADRTCYENGDDIVVNFRNCDPLSDDWIGVYAARQDFTSLQEPIAWVWTTGDQSQQAAIESGTITFFDVQGSGNFQIVLTHTGNGAPFSAHAVSGIFQLAQQCS